MSAGIVHGAHEKFAAVAGFSGAVAVTFIEVGG